MRGLILILTLCCLKAGAQNAEEEVKAPIQALFDGMRKTDSTLLQAAFAPGAILQTVVRNKEGKTVVRSEEVAGFITAISKPHAEVYDERITYELIRIDGDLAIAWTPYKFYVGEKFSHCGVNSFQLVRLDGKWKIQYLIDTRRREGCL
ncbi:MAG TPA: nuclear transport factor 2 family protein [Chitinophagaceae bacterium]|jgi:hypothetical protein|nr:nuclear transport factor 2 family protein [Chitinophagaceae bacterium]